MRVQVVQHDRDPFRCRVVPLGQLVHRNGPINPRAAFGDLHLAPAGERLTEQEQMGHPVPFIFNVSST